MTAILATLPVIAVAGDRLPRGKGHERTAQPRQERTRLVRSTTDANRLVSQVIQSARCNILRLDSLVAAMRGADAAIITAAVTP